MQGNGEYEEQHVIERSIVLVRLFIQSGDMVQVRCHQIQQVEQKHSADHTYDNKPPSSYSGFVRSRLNKAYGRSCEHNARTESENCIIPLVRDGFDEKSQ